MNFIDSRIAEIEQKRENRIEGNYNLIPFYDHFPRLSDYVPGLVRGVMYKIMSYTGVGKTQLTKYMFVLIPYLFAKKNNINLKIFYFAHEETKEDFLDSLICEYLAREHDIYISSLDLNSYFKTPLSKGVLEKIKEAKEYLQDIFEYVEVIDYISNPFGLFKHVRNYMRENGKIYFKGKEIDSNSTHMFDDYIPNDPNGYTIVVNDHIGLMSPEKGMTDHQTLTKWSADYCRKQLTKHYKCIVCNVQQLAMSGENVEHYKANRIEPTLDKAGDNKIILRDDMVIFGLFAPNRYEMEQHLGYDIMFWQDNYRSLSVLKNRLGPPNLKLPLYFDGAINRFKEMPKINTQEYREFKDWAKGQRNLKKKQHYQAVNEVIKEKKSYT